MVFKRFRCFSILDLSSECTQDLGMNMHLMKNLNGKATLKSHQKALLIMTIPGMIFFFVYSYLPMAGVIIAFKDFMIKKGIFASPWADPWYKYFKQFFSSPYCAQLLKNTLQISLIKIILGTVAALSLAVCLSEIRIPGIKKSIQTITYLPHFLSWVIIYGVIYALFSESSGLINVLLRQAGKTTIPILNSDGPFRMLLYISDIWKETGWGAIIYLAAIAGIDPGLYEAAEVDGANRIQRIWLVTLPSIRPTIIIMLILKMGTVLDAGFDQIFILYNSQVYASADIIDTWVYRMGLEQLNYSLSTAVGLFKSAMSMMMVLTVNAIARRWEESLW